MAWGSGTARALRDLTGAFVPLRMRELAREVSDRVEKVPSSVNEFGFDPYGFSPEATKRSALPAALLLGALGLLLPLWSALVAWLVPRAGFEWRYLAVAIDTDQLELGRVVAPGRTTDVQKRAVARQPLLDAA